MFGQNEEYIEEVPSNDYTEVTVYGEEPVEEWPSEARYIEAYQAAQEAAAAQPQPVPSEAGFPALQSILSSAATVIGQYLGVQKAKAQAQAVTKAQAAQAGIKLPSLTALGISTNTLLLIGAGVLAFILLRGGKGIEGKERRGRRTKRRKKQ